VSADRAVCDGLTRPPAACLATVRGARARCVRPTSASHYFRLRALAPRSFPASLRGLRLAPPPTGLHPGRRRLGDLAFHDARSASAGGLGLVARRVLPRTPDSTVPLTSLSHSRGPRSLARARVCRVCRDRVGKRSVKSRLHDDPGCLPPTAYRAMRGSHPLSRTVT
jgi:hypothetical protein